MIETHLEVCRESVEPPVSDTVRDYLALQVWNPGIGVLKFGIHAPNINGCHQERHYNSSMFLP
jgi:hypothetical protein